MLYESFQPEVSWRSGTEEESFAPPSVSQVGWQESASHHHVLLFLIPDWLCPDRVLLLLSTGNMLYESFEACEELLYEQPSALRVICLEFCKNFKELFKNF